MRILFLVEIPISITSAICEKILIELFKNKIRNDSVQNLKQNGLTTLEFNLIERKLMDDKYEHIIVDL